MPCKVYTSKWYWVSLAGDDWVRISRNNKHSGVILETMRVGVFKEMFGVDLKPEETRQVRFTVEHYWDEGG